MKINKFAFLFMSAVTINGLLANDIEEVIVSSSLIDQAASEIPNPLHVMSGNDISNNASKSLGETLNNLLGVSLQIMALELDNQLSEGCQDLG